MTMKLKYYLRGLGTGIVVTALVLGISLSHGKKSISDEEVKKRAAELGMVEEFKSLEEASKEKDTKEEDGGTKVSGNEAEGNELSDEGRVAGDESSTGKEAAGDKAAAENKTADDETSDENETADSKTQPVNQDTAKANDSKTDEKEDSKQDSDKGGFGSGIVKEEDSEAGVTEEENNQPDKQPEAAKEESSKPAGKSIVLEVHSGDGSLSVAKRAEKAGLVANAAEFDRFLCSGGYDKKICTGKHEIPEGATMEEIAKLLIQKP